MKLTLVQQTENKYTDCLSSTANAVPADVPVTWRSQCISRYGIYPKVEIFHFQHQKSWFLLYKCHWNLITIYVNTGELFYIYLICWHWSQLTSWNKNIPMLKSCICVIYILILSLLLPNHFTAYKGISSKTTILVPYQIFLKVIAIHLRIG